MAITSFFKRLWRSWLRIESPRRSVLKWSAPDKAGLVITCIAVAFFSSLHWLQVPEVGPGMPAPTTEKAPKDALVRFRESQQQRNSELIQSRIFVQVIDKKQSNILKERLNRKLNEIELVKLPL